MPDALTELRLRTLENLARGQPWETLLRELCLSVEAVLPGAIVGVTVLDRAARVFEAALFPSLDDSYAAKLRGALVAERPGSCALAVYEGRTVVSDDVANDARFQPGWKALSLEHGLLAIQSRPLCVDGVSLGTLVLGSAKPRTLDAVEETAVRSASDLAGLILARRRQDLQHELTIRELQHRARNIFATIGAVAYSTLRRHSEAKDFQRVFDGRLVALARAHSLAFNTDVDIRELMEDVLGPYRADHSIEADGAPFMLKPDAAVAFSLAIHELGTNAAKHGAFSAPGGRLFVSWNVTRDDRGEAFLVIEWVESGGPLVSTPAASGFGRGAIEQNLRVAVDATASFDFAPGGLRCRLSMPLSARLGAPLLQDAVDAPAALTPVA